jgi:hypothetical protein
MTIGTNILKEIGVTLTSESITREALIRKMGDTPLSFQDTFDGAIKYHHSMTCFSEELSVFLGQNDTKFLADLTNWYDSRDEWTYETKGAGKDKIQGVCFNFLGATAPDWIPTMFPQEAVGGGFTSRCFFIVEENKDKTVPLHMLSQTEIDLQAALIRDLERIHNLAGVVRFDDETTQIYVDWYTEQDQRNNAGHPAVADPRFAGYVDRRATHVRKLSMIMMASRGGTELITKSDFDAALLLMKNAEVRMAAAFGGLGRSQYAEAVETVLNLLIQRKSIRRSKLMQMLYRDIDSQSLRVVEEVLMHMRVVKIKMLPQEGDSIYEYIPPK